MNFPSSMWTDVDPQQVVSVEGQTLQCELGSEDHSGQLEVFREARSSFNRYQSLKEQSNIY